METWVAMPIGNPISCYGKQSPSSIGMTRDQMFESIKQAVLKSMNDLSIKSAYVLVIEHGSDSDTLGEFGEKDGVPHVLDSLWCVGDHE